MPWIPMYLTSDDVETLGLVLSRDKDIAMIVPDEAPYRWKASQDFLPPFPQRIAIWHVRSGPVPLVGTEVEEPDQYVADPLAGWTERLTDHDPSTPYFGVGRPGIIWLNLRPISPADQRAFGLSSFEWIGNRYKSLGLEAAFVTVRWWRSLNRRLLRIGKKVPRGTLSATLPPEVLAFPHAYRYLEAGFSADANPFDESSLNESLR